MRFGFWVGFEPILESRVFLAVLDPFYPLNEAKTSNQFPVMKTSTQIIHFFCAISEHKKAAKNTQAKVLEKIASWQHALLAMGEPTTSCAKFEDQWFNTCSTDNFWVVN